MISSQTSILAFRVAAATICVKGSARHTRKASNAAGSIMKDPTLHINATSIYCTSSSMRLKEDSIGTSQTVTRADRFCAIDADVARATQ